MTEERRKGLDEVVDHLRSITAKIDRQDVALFAKDSSNEFNSPGVMTVMQKLNSHLDMMCGMAKLGKKVMKFAFWLITAAGGAVAAAKAAGWL